MLLITIARQPAAEKEVQGEAVDVVLQEVGTGGNGVLQFFPPVVFEAVSQVVRLPVEEVVALLEAEDKVDKAARPASAATRESRIPAL